jgi:hypothetical protein
MIDEKKLKTIIMQLSTEERFHALIGSIVDAKLKNVSKVSQDCGKKDTEYGEKLERIMNWAEDNPDFNTKFIQSVYNQYEKHKTLSDKQKNSVDNIIKKFEIEV